MMGLIRLQEVLQIKRPSTLKFLLWFIYRKAIFWPSVSTQVSLLLATSTRFCISFIIMVCLDPSRPSDLTQYSFIFYAVTQYKSLLRNLLLSILVNKNYKKMWIQHSPPHGLIKQLFGFYSLVFDFFFFFISSISISINIDNLFLFTFFYWAL
jgi:hypothetical protein